MFDILEKVAKLKLKKTVLLLQYVNYVKINIARYVPQQSANWA